MRRFHKSQQGLPEGRIPTAKHGFTDRFSDRERHVFIHGRIQWVQLDQNGAKGCGENCPQNTHRQLLLHSDAIWVEKYRCNLSTNNDDYILWHDASRTRGLCGWHSGKIKEARRTRPSRVVKSWIVSWIDFLFFCIVYRKIHKHLIKL